jgi:hypothetical protein
LNKRSIFLVGIVVAAALARLAPHPLNVTPIAAMALFGGACYRDRKLAYLLPLAAMFLSDLILGFTRYDVRILLGSQPVVYACILATAGLGKLIGDRRSPFQVGAAALAGSLLFFVVTNFAVWLGGQFYPLTGSGLADCYVAAIPYFRNSVLGDTFFTTVLFGGQALLESRLAWMREDKTTVLA